MKYCIILIAAFVCGHAAANGVVGQRQCSTLNQDCGDGFECVPDCLHDDFCVERHLGTCKPKEQQDRKQQQEQKRSEVVAGPPGNTQTLQIWGQLRQMLCQRLVDESGPDAYMFGVRSCVSEFTACEHEASSAKGKASTLEDVVATWEYVQECMGVNRQVEPPKETTKTRLQPDSTKCDNSSSEECVGTIIYCEREHYKEFNESFDSPDDCKSSRGVRPAPPIVRDPIKTRPSDPRIN